MGCRTAARSPPRRPCRSTATLARQRGHPRTQGQHQHSQTLGMPARSGSWAMAPNTSNMSMFSWRLGLGSSLARASENLCFYPRGPFPTSISI